MIKIHIFYLCLIHNILANSVHILNNMEKHNMYTLCILFKEYIFNIEWHSMPKTMVTLICKKMRKGPGLFGPAG